MLSLMPFPGFFGLIFKPPPPHHPLDILFACFDTRLVHRIDIVKAAGKNGLDFQEEKKLPNGKWRFTYRDTTMGVARHDNKTVYLYS